MLSIIIKVYFLLNIYQQAYYGTRLYYKWIKKHYLMINLLLPLLLLQEKLDGWVIYTLIFLLNIVYFIYFLKREKRHLKFTKRAIRIYSLAISFALILSFVISKIVTFMFLELLLVLAVICLKPIDVYINKRYIRKAKIKLDNSNAKKIAITGSFAKTSVKNFCECVLSNKYLVKATPKSFNTPLGIARFANENDFTMTDFIIYEFGARHTNDIQELRKIYSYDIAIVTEIGMMHLDTFGSLEEIFKTKMDILNGLSKDGIAILNYENELIRNYKHHAKVLSYGFNYGIYQAKNLILGLEKTKFDLYIEDKFVSSFEIKLVGRHNVLNMLAALIICDLFEIDYQSIENIPFVENRLVYKKINDYHLLLDAYNSNIVGAKNALEIVKNHSFDRYIITPGLVECDKKMELLAEEYANAINQSVDYCLLIDNKFTRLMSECLNVEYQIFSDLKKAYGVFLNNHHKDSILLIENDLLDVY